MLTAVRQSDRPARLLGSGTASRTLHAQGVDPLITDNAAIRLGRRKCAEVRDFDHCVRLPLTRRVADPRLSLKVALHGDSTRASVSDAWPLLRAPICYRGHDDRAWYCSIVDKSVAMGRRQPKVLALDVHFLALQFTASERMINPLDHAAAPAIVAPKRQI